MKGLLSKRKPVVRAFWENGCGGDCLEPTMYGTNWDFLLLPFLPVGVAQEKAKCAVRLWELLGHPGALSADIYFVFAVIYVAVRNSKIVTVPKKWKYIKPKKELNVFLCGHPFKCQGHTPHSSTHEKEERQTPGLSPQSKQELFHHFSFPPSSTSSTLSWLMLALNSDNLLVLSRPPECKDCTCPQLCLARKKFLGKHR